MFQKVYETLAITPKQHIVSRPLVISEKALAVNFSGQWSSLLTGQLAQYTWINII